MLYQHPNHLGAVAQFYCTDSLENINRHRDLAANFFFSLIHHFLTRAIISNSLGAPVVVGGTQPWRWKPSNAAAKPWPHTGSIEMWAPTGAPARNFWLNLSQGSMGYKKLSVIWTITHRLLSICPQVGKMLGTMAHLFSSVHFHKMAYSRVGGNPNNCFSALCIIGTVVENLRRSKTKICFLLWTTSLYSHTSPTYYSM